ncbi:hypothetical protein [Haloarchaeobius iranensis]|uniref:Uncharacterized protein n=1 Tax=Haloarchaeobius iranensis TaxID=996166 RepID=A0A1G9ZG23_9EURY|nr:hypothetical protein [Haloarchaeobius iranensis]SDN20224.1 hypothetical protein SAMN05192554_12031 [Haloarchaeobius iranensis]
MDRRRLLTSLGLVALPGCSALDGPETEAEMTSDTTTTPPETTATPTATPTAEPTATVEPPDSIADANISFHVETLREATSEHPAEIEIGVTNEGRPRDLNFVGSAPLSSEFVGDGPEPEGLLLAPHERHDAAIIDENGDHEFTVVPGSRRGECWNRIDIPYSPPNSGFKIILGREETFTNTYSVLVNSPRGCIPAGEYTFESEFQIPDDGLVEFAWEFSLTYPVTV